MICPPTPIHTHTRSTLLRPFIFLSQTQNEMCLHIPCRLIVIEYVNHTKACALYLTFFDTHHTIMLATHLHVNEFGC